MNTELPIPRILGVTALACCGLLLYPLVFSGPVDSAATAEPPATPPASIPQLPDELRALEPLQVEPPPAVDDSPQPPALSPEVPEDDSPILDTGGRAHGWVVQLASYNDQERAEQMVRQLRQAKYRSFRRRVVLGDDPGPGPWHRVLVGPVLNPAEARRLRARLILEYPGTDPVIYAYQP